MAEYIFRSEFFSNYFSTYQFRIPHSAFRIPKLIMDFCDLDSDKWLQYSCSSRFPMTLVYRTESSRLLEYECQVNQHFDHSVFVSQNEADLFLGRCPHARNVSVIPNGVDYEYFSPKQLTPSTQSFMEDSQPATRNSQPILLFTGAMDYRANIDGVTWFCNKIYPIVKRRFPQVKFYIVGANASAKVRSLATNDSVKVTGFVEDILPYYAAATICVIPLRFARGVQNKVLEAMAVGKAVVTTSKGINGICAIPREHLLVEDEPQGFAEAVSQLLTDRILSERLGERAREFAMIGHDWPTHMKKLEVLLHTDQ